MAKLILRTREVAALLGITPKTLTVWKSLGADSSYLGIDKWDGTKLFHWWLENIYKPIDKTDPSLQAERLRWEKGRADKIELQVAELKGLVKPIEQIAKDWAARMAVIVNGLTMYEDRLPPVLEGKSQGEMRKIIKQENRRLRDWYCRQGGAGKGG